MCVYVSMMCVCGCDLWSSTDSVLMLLVYLTYLHIKKQFEVSMFNQQDQPDSC